MPLVHCCGNITIWGKGFKDTILAESKDPNYAVRFSVMNSLLFYYDFDRSFAVNIFNSMIGSDLRMIASPGSWQIFIENMTAMVPIIEDY